MALAGGHAAVPRPYRDHVEGALNARAMLMSDLSFSEPFHLTSMLAARDAPCNSRIRLNLSAF